ncbi:MAG: hypothetical protein ACW960_08725 [Candidatus Thorarchaeota archaeon]
MDLRILSGRNESKNGLLCYPVFCISALMTLSQLEQTIILTRGGFSFNLPNCDLMAPLANLDILPAKASSIEKKSSSNSETKPAASFIRNSSEQNGHFGMFILLKNAYVLLRVKSRHRPLLVRGYRFEIESMRPRL